VEALVEVTKILELDNTLMLDTGAFVLANGMVF
jgi:hypothetical protein